MSSTKSRRLQSGLLDALVERIARSTNSSAVFVSAESPATDLSLVAEFPVAASIQLDRYPSEGAAHTRWSDGPMVAIPVRSEQKVMGWAAAVGPSLDHDREAEELVTLLAQCATALLGQQSTDAASQPQRSRWEDAARDGYWEWDFESGVMRFSRRSLALLEYQGVDRPTRPDVWLDHVHPDDRAGVYAALLTAATVADAVDHEHRLVQRDGSIRRVVMRAGADHDDAGRPIRLVGWLCDVSRLRRVESDLRNAQLLADVGRVAACAAHDFNNFLTVIRGHTELALGFIAPDSPAAENLELIKHAAAGATTLTKQLLNIRRRQTPVQTVIDLNEVVSGAERTLRSLVGTRGDLAIRPRPGLGLVRADAAQIHRLLINLVVNALDAMPEGGKVTIATDSTTGDTLGGLARPLLLPRGDYVTLSVLDTGAGMDDATRSRIFEPFFSTKPSGQGTGLGLWIVRDIMERSGGAIDVRSTPGTGTEFVMYFPAAENVVV